MNECPTCGKEAKVKYCSRDCANKAKKVNWECVCRRCGEKFYHNNKSYITLGRLKYCSQECKNRKFQLNESYFTEILKSEVLETFGQIIAIGQIKDYRTLKLYSNFETLSDINKKLNSNYKITKSSNKKYKLCIFSDKIVSDLISLGLSNNPLKQDVPREDIWEGLKKTHCYKEIKNYCFFTTESSKIAAWVSDKFSTPITSKLYRDTERFNSSVPMYIITWKVN